MLDTICMGYLGWYYIAKKVNEKEVVINAITKGKLNSDCIGVLKYISLQIKSPHLVKIIDVIEDANYYYVVYEKWDKSLQ